MKPVLFNLGAFKIYGYGTMIAIGICAAVLLVTYRAKKRGYNEDKILDMSIVAIILGIIGGKLMYIITDFKNIMEDPSILKDFGAGFVIYGAILGGILGAYIYCKFKKWNVLKIMDLCVPSLPLAQGFGRIGCLFAGCCYGAETNSPFSIVFKEGSLAPAGVHLHPTQIYSSIFDFALALGLLWYAKKERKSGRVLSLYLIIYSIGRFMVEFLRNDPRGNVGALSTSQFISIFILIIGVMIFNMEALKKLILKTKRKEEITGEEV